MSRKTLPLTAFLLLSAGLGTACSGTDTGTGRPPPEICNDGIDNNDNGKIDCDDTEACGGLQCQTTVDDTDITVELPSAEILFNPKTCCDFSFTQGDCPLLVGTYQAANRELDTNGELDASCDLIGGEAPLTFSVEGCVGAGCDPIPFMVNHQVDPNTTVTVDVWFECLIGQTFTSTCHTELDVDPFSDDHEFEVTGTRVESLTVSLTGIKPTGRPHIGNWLGMIRPAIALADEPGVSAYYFIADYHALTSVRDRAEMRMLTLDVAATWLAFGLDPARILLYRQSDVPEVFELSWILACHTPKGFMNKAHAYKAARDANVEAGEDPDAGIGMGLFTYPVLMAADILAVDADLVPVGKDQVQHVEIARDIAARLNHTWGEGTLRLPAAKLTADAAIVLGTDGRKMSKSYDNTLPCFDSAKALRKAVMRIATDSTPPEAPKDPSTSLVYQIHRTLLDAPAGDALAERYRAGISWGEAKRLLADDLEQQLAPARERYAAWITRTQDLDDLLADGGRRVRAITAGVLGRVRERLGIV